MLEAILKELPEDQTLLFNRWPNMRRDIAAACNRIDIDRVSPNDLRRTFGSWLNNRGLDSAVIMPAVPRAQADQDGQEEQEAAAVAVAQGAEDQQQGKGSQTEGLRT